MTTEKLYYTREEIEKEVIPVIRRMADEKIPVDKILRAFNNSHGYSGLRAKRNSFDPYIVHFYYCAQYICSAECIL